MAQLNPDRYLRLTNPITYGQSDGVFWDKTNSRLVVVVGDSVYEAPLHIASQARGDILRRGASSWERHSAKASGQILVGDGTDVASVAVSGDATLASSGALTVAAASIVSSMLDPGLIQSAAFSIANAAIIGTSAGELSHAAGYEMVAAVADKAHEFIACIVEHDYDTAAYTGGGDLSVNLDGGNAVSGSVEMASLLGAGSDKIALLKPTSQELTANTALQLVVSAAITDPGTAAGLLKGVILYRSHDLGLA
jgi:hypothetical protein